MALTPAGLIEQARALDATFTPLTHPNSVLLTYLGRCQRTLMTDLATVDPSFSVTTENTALPLATFADGITLTSEPLRITGIDLVPNIGDYRKEVKLVGFAQRNSSSYFPSAYLAAGVIYLIPPEVYWNGTDWASIDVHYIPIPAAPTTLATALALPDDAENVLVAYLARFMTSRVNEGVSVPLAVRDADLAAERDRFLELHHQRGGVTVDQIEEVW